MTSFVCPWSLFVINPRTKGLMQSTAMLDDTHEESTQRDVDQEYEKSAALQGTSQSTTTSEDIEERKTVIEIDRGRKQTRKKKSLPRRQEVEAEAQDSVPFVIQWLGDIVKTVLNLMKQPM